MSKAHDKAWVENDVGQALLAAISFVVMTLFTACAEHPPRYDIPPPSRAHHYLVAITQAGAPNLVTPYGAAGGALGGALAGGYGACWFSVGVGCAAAPVVMPVTAAIGLLSAETGSNIAQLKTALERHDVARRVGPLLTEALLASGNRRAGYRFVAATDAIDPHSPLQQVSLIIEWERAGIVIAEGQEVFELLATGRLERQEPVPLSYRSAKRSASAWLMNDGAAIEAAMHDATQALANDMLGQVFAAH